VGILPGGLVLGFGFIPVYKLEHMPETNQITQVLQAIVRSESGAAEQLLPLVYEDLRRLATARMANEMSGQTLQPTALVHEAWLRLVTDEDRTWQNRAHFFGAAAEAMRRILIERARKRQAVRHGGALQRINDDLDQVVVVGDDGPTLAAAVRFASIDQNTPVILISGDSHPSLWYYADRPIKMHVWSIDSFNDRLTDTTADLPFAFQQQCPAPPIAVIVPKLYANAAKDLLAHLRSTYRRLDLPSELSEQYEIFALPN